ncbi:hypothetical protein HK101_007086, partial [Irineochytrium annulatum]
AQLYTTLYDLSSPSAASGTENAAKVGSSSNSAGWAATRPLLFWLSMLIRVAFLAEMGLRVAADIKGLVTDTLRLMDCVVVVFAAVMKVALPARESLVLDPILLLRLWRVGGLIATRRDGESVDARVAWMEEERRADRSAVERERREKDKWRRVAEASLAKLRVLMGEDAYQQEMGGQGVTGLMGVDIKE